ncbi:MAG: ATP-grasp fold amidoligase family protein, partial [Gammaproteobacteria bacterium]|nr:ATP-grasp fold amidoligase family protein [Gammaproteobacteria bacterium]
GSGSNYIRFVENREAFSKQQFETDIAKLKGSPCGWALGEFHYAAIPLKIMAEEYLINGDEPILDYKFYCFHGEVAFISAEQGKVKGRAFRDYYDLNWQRSHVDFFYDHPRPYKLFSKPKNFERMLKMARSLSEGYPHLRVDLYNLDGRIYFGELTYAPENGLTRWKPQSLDFEYGQRIDLDNINH